MTLCVEEANRLCWQQFIIFSQKSTWAARAPLAFASTVQRMKKVKAVFVFFPPQKQASPEELRPIQIRIYCICLQKRHSSYRKQALSHGSCLLNHLLSKLPPHFLLQSQLAFMQGFILVKQNNLYVLGIGMQRDVWRCGRDEEGWGVMRMDGWFEIGT